LIALGDDVVVERVSTLLGCRFASVGYARRNMKIVLWAVQHL